MFVWIGSGASADEKRNAMTHAHVRCKTSCKCIKLYSLCLELPHEDESSVGPSVLFEGRI